MAYVINIVLMRAFYKHSEKSFALIIPIFCFYLCDRGGRGGGYKELDEEELEETRRRRKEAEEVGGDLTIIQISNDILSKKMSNDIKYLFFTFRMTERCMMSLAISKRNSVQKLNKLKLARWLLLVQDVLDGILIN